MSTAMRTAQTTMMKSHWWRKCSMTFRLTSEENVPNGKITLVGIAKKIFCRVMIEAAAQASNVANGKRR